MVMLMYQCTDVYNPATHHNRTKFTKVAGAVNRIPMFVGKLESWKRIFKSVT